MTQEIKRVVVLLDAASETGTTINTAARLAACWQVLLHGIFIEDEELIGLHRAARSRSEIGARSRHRRANRRLK
jgi:hypothetical protein